MLAKVVTDVRSMESPLTLLHNIEQNRIIEYGQNSKEAPKTYQGECDQSENCSCLLAIPGCS